MDKLKQHFIRCAVAGVVALLPVLGLVLLIAQLETWISNSGLRRQGYYFFGQGILAALTVVYLVGLATTTLIGNWLWRFFDHTIDRMPLLGAIYRSMKQILGCGDGPDTIFKRVVYLDATQPNIEEIGLVTREANPADPESRLTVFLPLAPIPSNGRLVFVHSHQVRGADMSVNEALKLFVSLGAIHLPESPIK